ncbi:tetratricopeptide repeat protein [Acidovorax sp. sic0104]
MANSPMKTAIIRLLGVSTLFLLGGVTTGVSAQGCGPASGNSNVTKAESLISANQSREAYVYLNLAREEGNGEAFRYTAEMFEKGRGVERNPSMARHMFSFGAQSGDAESMYRTAQDYYKRGLKKDGEHWASRAKECGHMGAVMLLVEQAATERRNEVARDLLTLAIDAGYSPAKLYLAEVFDKGQLGLQKDYQSAFKWYYLAAKDHIPEAMAAVAYYFVRAQHGVQDDVAALHWYHEAAKAGHVESMTAYGWMLAMGRGGPVDIEEAHRFFKKAERKGDKQAVVFQREFAIANVRRKPKGG